jgi:hypothetical protein
MQHKFTKSDLLIVDAGVNQKMEPIFKLGNREQILNNIDETPIIC